MAANLLAVPEEDEGGHLQQRSYEFIPLNLIFHAIILIILIINKVSIIFAIIIIIIISCSLGIFRLLR